MAVIVTSWQLYGNAQLASDPLNLKCRIAKIKFIIFPGRTDVTNCRSRFVIGCFGCSDDILRFAPPPQPQVTLREEDVVYWKSSYPT